MMPCLYSHIMIRSAERHFGHKLFCKSLLGQRNKPSPCGPLTLVQYLDLTLRSADCDSNFGSILDGVMRVSNLTTVFTGPSETLRGVHAADFY